MLIYMITMTNKLIKNFCFTWNNYDDKAETFLKDYYTAYCNYLIYGFEEGQQTHTKHIQGYIQLKKYRRFNSIMKDFNKKIHIEDSKGTPEQNKIYCSKEGNFKEFGTLTIQGSNRVKKENIRELIKKCNSYNEVLEIEGIEKYLKFAQEYYNSLDKRRPDLYKDVILKDWQKLINDYLNNEGDNRTILFVIDEKGGQGKTFLSSYLYNTRDDIFYTTNGKTSDILYNYSKSLKHNIIFDITRNITLNKVNYDAIESICNPIFTSNKYNSMTLFREKKSNIIVFTNDYRIKQLKDYLSIDRIKILNLGDEQPIIKTYSEIFE